MHVTHRTPIVDAEHIHNSMMKSWDTATDEVKAAYGKDYFDSFVKAIAHSGDKANPNIYEVIDDMEDAVLGLEPQVKYSLPNTTLSFIYLLFLYNVYLCIYMCICFIIYLHLYNTKNWQIKLCPVRQKKNAPSVLK